MRTGTTLSIMTVALLSMTFVPVNIMMRASSLGMAVTFFGLFPISSRYPEYRYVVSPVKWIFWKVPSHGKLLTCLSHHSYLHDFDT